MKKLYFVLAFSLVLLKGSAQDILLNFTHSYYRSDPFQTTTFSGFLKHLMNDPTLKEKVTHQKTDSSFFSFEGTYTNYNPFFFKPKRVEVFLEETPITYEQWPQNLTDTIFNYHLIAYSDNTPAGIKEIKKEVEKINRLYKKRFMGSKYFERKEGEEIAGATYNYFIPDYALSPLSVGWGKLKTGSETVLVITLRIKPIGNETNLPQLFYNP